MRLDSHVLRRCWFLAGATASGKTAAGVALARRINAEILSLDSMAVYRGMDIGTAKPTLDERQGVPHHLIDIVDPADRFSVVDYLEAAAQVCAEVLNRGRTPLFVGGTGLYLRAVLRGVFEGPAADPLLREELEGLARELSPEALHRRLVEVDPLSAARLSPRDVRRVVRALEIHRLTGQPASEQQREEPLPESERPRRVFWLSPPRSWLHDRINRRVESMFSAGLVDEVRRLAGGPRGLGRTAAQGLGYKEVLEHLAGEATLAQAIETVQTRTRQFAKRQETWFRNLVECRPAPLTGAESAEEVAMRLARLGQAANRH